MKKKELILTILLFIIILSMRIPYINNITAEYGHSWRQCDTDSIARNFVNDKFNILYPQLNYDGPPPNYVQLEFQITTYLIAILYKTFGQHIFLARLVTIAFFMISVFYLFILMKEIYNIKLAWLTIFIYSILPINIFFSRAVMPESAVLCFFNGSFYYFYKWYKDEKNSSLLLSGTFTALAISQKTPAIFIGIAMIMMCIDKYGVHFIKKIDLWIFGVISLVPPFIYIIWSGGVARYKFVNDIGAKHIVPKFASSIFTGEAIEFFKKGLPSNFTGIILVLAILGVLTLRDKKERPIIYLLISILLETIFIVSVIRFRYYLIFLAPIIAIISSKFLYYFFSLNRNRGYIFIILILSITLYSSYNNVKGDFTVYESSKEFAETIDKFTEEEDLIVIANMDPSKISMSNRKGWRANIKYYDYIPRDIEGEINYFKQNGARYFITDNNYIYDDDGSYLKYLEDNFEKFEVEGRYRFYKLIK